MKTFDKLFGIEPTHLNHLTPSDEQEINLLLKHVMYSGFKVVSKLQHTRTPQTNIHKFYFQVDVFNLNKEALIQTFYNWNELHHRIKVSLQKIKWCNGTRIYLNLYTENE